MWKKLIFIIFFILVIHTSTKEVRAQAFECIINSNNNNACETGNLNCGIGKYPVFIDQTDCTNYSTETCPTGLNFQCYDPTLQTGSNPPLNQPQQQPREPFEQFCVPEGIHCAAYNTLLVECGPNTDGVILKHCDQEGKICQESAAGANCVTPPTPQASSTTAKFKCTTTGCVRDDVNGTMSSLNTCKLDCPTATGGSSVTPTNIIDLNELIASIGLNPKLFAGGKLTLGSIIAGALPFLLGIAGMLLLLILIYGGYQYLLSAGDPKKTEAAKGTLTAAIIGFILIICAFLITQLLSNVFKLGGVFG